jgi:hypothetical protein
MPVQTEYKLITGSNPPDFQAELRKAANDGWRPILLTSTSVGEHLIIIAIADHPVGG